MLLLSAGGKLSISKEFGAFFAQLLHGGCDGNGQRHGAQNGLRFSALHGTERGGLNFARSTGRGVYRSADGVQVVADCFAEGVRHWFSFRCALNMRGGVGAHPRSLQMGEGLNFSAFQLVNSAYAHGSLAGQRG